MTIRRWVRVLEHLEQFTWLINGLADIAAVPAPFPSIKRPPTLSQPCGHVRPLMAVRSTMWPSSTLTVRIQGQVETSIGEQRGTHTKVRFRISERGKSFANHSVELNIDKCHE